MNLNSILIEGTATFVNKAATAVEFNIEHTRRDVTFTTPCYAVSKLGEHIEDKLSSGPKQVRVVGALEFIGGHHIIYCEHIEFRPLTT